MMSDVFIRFIIIIFAFVPAILMVVFLPFHLYNNAWRALTQSHPILSVFSAQRYGPSNYRDGYYRLSGITPKIFGLICLVYGLSMQIFAIDFAYHFSPTSYATLSQKIEVWIWFGTLIPLAFASYWVPPLSMSAERLRDEEEYELFFWGGFLRMVMNRLRSGRKLPSRMKRRSRGSNGVKS